MAAQDGHATDSTISVAREVIRAEAEDSAGQVPRCNDQRRGRLRGGRTASPDRHRSPNTAGCAVAAPKDMARGS